ncbi:hypothetical protein ACQFN5_28375 (plasmid) [Klebsiella sp. WOUb02]|uniref:hypothetical protein n=1 Tax=Klebsiella sp. WOUb02 TaxID=3161071 RepID=UPI003CF8A82A
MREQWRTYSRRLRSFWRQEQGAGTAFYVLGTMGLLVISAFIVDSLQTTGDAAQVKRATDAAALAVGHQVVASNEKNEDVGQEQITELAYQYIRTNLGLNSKLTANLSRDKVSVSSGRNSDDNRTYTVAVTFDTDPELLNISSQEQLVYSTVEVRTASLEVALALPNTLKEDSSNLAALRRISNTFAEDLIGNSYNTWLALVPYSQAVNVYDVARANRIRQWVAEGALNPVELTSLFRSGYGSLADRRIPDRRYNRLCMYRGLDRGENYFWDESPVNQFFIYYRHDLPENSGINYNISWIGPNPDFGQANGVNDTRYMIVDHGCPVAPLLPLTSDFDKISTRLNSMSTGFNVNYAIAMGWAAMSLAPEFRGSSGWGGGMICRRSLTMAITST